MGVSLVVLRCRTSDRTPGRRRAARRRSRRWWASAWAWSRATIGAAARSRETRFEDDLRDSRGCLLEAGGQVDDALAGGDVPAAPGRGLLGLLTTLPAALRNRPEARVLWLDAHGDYNTPDTTGSGFLGGMCLAGACGEWDAGLAEPVRRSGWCSPGCATSTRASASCWSAAR